MGVLLGKRQYPGRRNVKHILDHTIVDKVRVEGTSFCVAHTPSSPDWKKYTVWWMSPEFDWSDFKEPVSFDTRTEAQFRMLREASNIVALVHIKEMCKDDEERKTK